VYLHKRVKFKVMNYMVPKLLKKLNLCVLLVFGLHDANFQFNLEKKAAFYVYRN
jgi:hypothetical protein